VFVNHFLFYRPGAHKQIVKNFNKLCKAPTRNPPREWKIMLLMHNPSPPNHTTRMHTRLIICKQTKLSNNGRDRAFGGEDFEQIVVLLFSIYQFVWVFRAGVFQNQFGARSKEQMTEPGLINLC
jgi:hypothetical protein